MVIGWSNSRDSMVIQGDVSGIDGDCSGCNGDQWRDEKLQWDLMVI